LEIPREEDPVVMAGSIGLMEPGKSAPRSGGSGVLTRERTDAPSTEVLAGHSPETATKAMKGGGKPTSRNDVEVPSYESSGTSASGRSRNRHMRESAGVNPSVGASPW